MNKPQISWATGRSVPPPVAREVRTLADVLTLVTMGDSDIRMAVLVDLTVVQGEPQTLAVTLPAGYELTGLTSDSVDGIEPRDGIVPLSVRDPKARTHQFLLSLERSHAGGSFSVDTGLVSVRDVERERGEVAVEGVGTLELVAEPRGSMRRIDVRELNQPLQSLARLPLLAGFRYQRTAAAVPGLALEVKRFADAGRARRRRRSRRRDDAAHGRGTSTDRAQIDAAEPCAAVHESDASRRCIHGVGRGRWRIGQTCHWNGWHPRAAASSGFPPVRPVQTCRSCTWTRAHRSPAKDSCR